MIRIRFDIRTWWHAGAGRGTGQLLDALVVKQGGLPYLPGRTVKGLIRDAVRKAETWGHLDGGTCERLFGSNTLGTKVHACETHQGVLDFDDGLMDPALVAWLGHGACAPYRERLFGEMHATAICQHRGQALKESLRGIEVTVPLTLYAPVHLNRTTDEDWPRILSVALPLIRGLGQARHRGLGRVVVTLEEVPHAA